MTLLKLTKIEDHLIFISEMKPFNIESKGASEFDMGE